MAYPHDNPLHRSIIKPHAYVAGPLANGSPVCRWCNSRPDHPAHAADARPCCCLDCSGPDGLDCTPDTFTGDCIRCGRKAEHIDTAETADILEAIAARIASQADGQTSWLS